MQGSCHPLTPGWVTRQQVCLMTYWTIRLDASANLVRIDVAVHEWLGLIAYRLTGRTDALLPDAEPER